VVMAPAASVTFQRGAGEKAGELPSRLKLIRGDGLAFKLI